MTFTRGRVWKFGSGGLHSPSHAVVNISDRLYVVPDIRLERFEEKKGGSDFQLKEIRKGQCEHRERARLLNIVSYPALLHSLFLSLFLSYFWLDTSRYEQVNKFTISSSPFFPSLYLTGRVVRQIGRGVYKPQTFSLSRDHIIWLPCIHNHFVLKIHMPTESIIVYFSLTTTTAATTGHHPALLPPSLPPSPSSCNGSRSFF